MAAITGIFQADFKSFYDAVAQAKVKLKDFQSDAEAVAQKVDKVANAFSGRKLVQDAEIMTKAITEIGGATALTAKEQAQVNAKLAEAIEKYKALGQVAPKEMQDLEKATRQVNQETAKTSTGFKDIGGSLLKMASAVGIAFSADAVLGFVKSVFDTASQVQDMSEKLGISAKAVQQFTYAANQAGATIDDVGAAIFKMNQKLAEGDKSTVHALKDLNLSLDDLRQMSPEQAFLAITDALAKIENPAARARLEVELFGKAGGAMGAAIAAGFREAADAAVVMEDDTVKALSDAQQAWENLANKVTTVTGLMIAETAQAVESLTSSWQGFAMFVGNTMRFGVGAAMTIQSGMLQSAAPGKTNLSPAELAEIQTQGGFGAPITAGSAETERLAREREAALRKQKAAVDELRRAEDEYAQLLAGDVLKAYEDTRKALENYYAIILKANDSINTGTEGLTLRKNTEVNILSGLTGQWLAYLDAVNSVNSKVTTGLDSAPGKKVDTDFLVGDFLKKLPTVTGEFNKLGAAVSQLGGLLGSNLLGQLGATVSAFSKVQGAIGDLKGGFEKMTSGGGLTSILGGFTSITSGIGTIVAAAQAAIQIGRMLFGIFDRNKGRDAVVDFAESMGGFDALQKQLEALGEEGARLWVKLTQGTDKGNPEQAARNIAEVEEALRKHQEAAGDVTDATEEQARATIETASEAERAMKALEPLLKANEDQWRAWGDVVNGQIDRVAGALRSLALPTLSGDALQPPAPAGGGGTAVINLDGRQIAEAVVPRIPGVVRRYGLA